MWISRQTFDERMRKIYWRRELSIAGRERKESVTPELAEALRKEIRHTLDADGKPFDINVARRVYDLAIAARDFCIAATETVGEAIKQIADTDGPMESLQTGSPPPLQAAETFGAKLIRELLAALPQIVGRQPTGQEDPEAMVHALAAARRAGMTDVAEAIERKMIGHALDGPRPVVVDEETSAMAAAGSPVGGLTFETCRADGCLLSLGHAGPHEVKRCSTEGCSRLAHFGKCFEAHP